jgi:hypothetical protein
MNKNGFMTFFPWTLHMDMQATVRQSVSHSLLDIFALCSTPVSVVFIPLVFAGRGDFRPSDLERWVQNERYFVLFYSLQFSCTIIVSGGAHNVSNLGPAIYYLYWGFMWFSWVLKHFTFRKDEVVFFFSFLFFSFLFCSVLFCLRK